jgi:hypothetical protein
VNNAHGAATSASVHGCSRAVQRPSRPKKKPRPANSAVGYGIPL